MTSFECDQQQCHHAAVGLSISRLVLAPGSASTLISTSATATERVRKCVRVQVPLRVSGSGTERVLSFVRAVVSHVPDSSTVKAAPLK